MDCMAIKKVLLIGLNHFLILNFHNIYINYNMYYAPHSLTRVLLHNTTRKEISLAPDSEIIINCVPSASAIDELSS